MKTKKHPAITSPHGIKQATPKDTALRFSFKLFDGSDEEVCPKVFRDGYVKTLMERLKSLSTWTVSEFLTSRSSAIRSHPIDWSETKRPDGFRNLNEQLQSYTAYQFALSANEYGRVHGLLIDDTFHVVWLDCDHKVYS